MKKIIKVLLFILLAFTTSKVSAISFNLDIKGESTVIIGNTINLTSEYWVGNDVYDPDTPIGEVSRTDVTTQSTWTSSNTNVATISDTGVVTGVAVGTTTIKAVYTTGDITREATKVIRVTDNSKQLSISGKNDEPGLVFKAGTTGFVLVELTNIPVEERGNITATTDDETIVKVKSITPLDTAGMNNNETKIELDILKVGTVTLTVSLVYQGETYSDTYEFTTVETYNYLTLELNGNNENIPKTIKAGEELDFQIINRRRPSLPPRNVTNAATWTSSDNKIATVDKGKVKGIKKGKVTITVTYQVDDETVTYSFPLEVTEEEDPISDKPSNNKKSTDPVIVPSTPTNNICKKVDGIYYGKNGEIITEEDFSNDCNPKTGASLNIITIISLIIFMISAYVYLRSTGKKIYKV